MVIARSAVVRRSVSGIAWYDYNNDGIRGPEDKTLEGIEVALVDASGNPVKSLADGTTQLTATTAADGSYRMDDVPAGSGYKLVFKPASANSWKTLKVTVKDNPDAQLSERSCADPDQRQTTGDPLRSASITLADFPAVSAMHSSSYDDTYENAGITGKLPSAPSIMANGFKVQKVLNGRTGAWLTGEQYTFDIEAQGSAPAAGTNGPVPSSVTVTNGSVKTVPVDGTKFDLPGTYVYKVTEHASSQAGVTPDASTSQSYLVTVTVADDMTTMTRTVTTSMKDDHNADVSSDTATFTNQYKAAPVSVTPAGSKVLVSTPGNSHAPLAAGEFGFTLSETSRPAGAAAIADQHATNATDGSITFPSMTFDQAGTYKFQMTEDAVSDVHISRDATVYTLTYTVTDDQTNAQLVASAPVVTSDPSGSSTAKFTNVYDPSKSVFEIRASKSMTNADPATHRAPAAGEFNFKLEAVDGTRAVDGAAVAKADVPMPAAASGSAIEMTNQADGAVAFGGMQYAYPGVFNYKVSEIVPSGSAKDPSLDYDTRVYDVAVTVTDVAGTLTAVSAVSLDGSPAAGNTAAFDNKYTPAPVDVSLDAKKTMSGRPLVDGEFSALLAPVAGNPVDGSPSNGSQEKTIAKVTDSEGSVSFDSLRFSRVGDWNYTITEKPGALGGVAYDNTVHNVLVHVTEDATNHKLVAQVTLSHDGITETDVTLHNAYTPAPVSDVVDAIKKVKSSEGNAYQLKAGDFSFTLHRVSAPADANAQADVSASNAADGRIVLPAVSMDKIGDYVFTLSEDSTVVPGITRDPTVYSVTYRVTDDLQGHLVISSKTLNKLDASGSSVAADSAVFTNAYDPKHVAVSLGGVKSVRNTDAGTHRTPANGEFEFALTALDGTDASGAVAADKVPMPSDAANGKSTVKNVGPAFTFGSIAYAHPGTYRYRIGEIAGHDPSISYDSRSYVVTVTVNDVAGVLSAATDKNVSDVLIENVYTPAATDADLTVGKVLDGRPLKDGEFGVVLTPNKDNPKDGEKGALTALINRVNTAVPVSSAISPKSGYAAGLASKPSVATVNAEGQGQAKFSMKFSHTGVWRYTLTEANGAEHGVTYDRTSYGVTVKVTEDAASHQLVAAVALDRDGSSVDTAVFHNEYRPDPVAAKPNGSAAAAPRGESPKGLLAKTGDNIIALVALVLTLLLAGGSLILARRRRIE
ncbi:LPXTG cell wall anchor domain-containing protein [Bifidobacterium sp. ESL0682]|nr:FctA domain-containing protein [Bifidobacterium sp. ESL0682]WEV42767.1 LPXTG cell wall anchor domain-containing protein [Bifidobacterium sp. ESL0682]